MKIYINKNEYSLDENCTLAQALTEAGMTRPGIAVAIDNRVVKRGMWPDVKLTDGMEITVISAVCGG